MADFLSTLASSGVTDLLDIRDIAASRRPGFAKTALRANLSGAGIAYRHEPKLGSPRAIRHQLRQTGDYEIFFDEFDRYLGTQQALLVALATELSGSVALMCYERDYHHCHRKSVAAAISKLTGCTLHHLVVEANRIF